MDNFGLKHFSIIIKSFGRNQFKFSKNFENPYFMENPYRYPSVYARIHPYIWQHCKCSLRLVIAGLILKYGFARCLFKQFFAETRFWSFWPYFLLTPLVKFRFPTFCTFCWIASQICLWKKLYIKKKKN